MHVLVIGCTGYVGSALCRYLVKLGVNVTGVSRSPIASPHFETMSLPNLGDLAAAAGDRFDVIVNAAAAGVHPHDRDEERLVYANAALPAILVEQAAQMGKPLFIQIGTCSEYAEQPDGLPVEESGDIERKKLYGATKARGSMAAMSTAHRMGVPLTVLRLFNVFGPGEPVHRLLPSLVSHLATARFVKLSIGTQVRDFICIDDVLRAIYATIEGMAARPAAPGIYNVCTGVGTSVAEFARCACRSIGADESLLLFGAIPMRLDDAEILVGSPLRFQSRFDWSPSVIGESIKVAALEELKRFNGNTAR